MMLYVALLVGLAALFFAWRCSRAVQDLQQRNARLSSQLYDLRLEMRRSVEAQQQEIMRLRYEALRQAGNLYVTGATTVDEITTLHPQAAAVLAGFHIGGCASCAVDSSTRLEEAVAANGGQLEPLLVALNNLALEAANGTPGEERLRAPNVQLVM
jgi:hypothetical protein